jgi:hypothetical protein
MNRVNCRELLEKVRDRDHWLRGEFPDIALADRVDKVLSYCADERGGEERESLARTVLRLLNGEEP